MSKKYVLHFLILLVLAVAFCSQAYAAVVFKVTAATNTIASQVAGKKNVVLTAFYAKETNVGANSISAFTVGNAAGGTGDGTEVVKISIYRDMNSDGKFDSDDVLVPGATSIVTGNYLGGVVLLTPTDPEPIAQDETKYYLVVVDLSTVPGAFTDGDSFGVLLGGSDSVPTAISFETVIGDLTQAAVPLNIVATHLQFDPVGYKPQVATGGQLLNDNLNILSAVDDYSNLDVNFGEGVLFSAVNYNTFDDMTVNLTATGYQGGGSIDAKAVPLTMTAGLIGADTGTTNGTLKSLLHATAGPVTIIATSQTNKLEGSVTVCNQVYPVGTPIVNLARGMEVYDANHNGHIDHMTIFFNMPVEGNGAVIAEFSIGGGYSLTGTVVSSYDAGGVGIRNAGAYGITVQIMEKEDVYDTEVTPDLNYNVSNKIRSLGAGTPNAASIGSAQAVKVDRARPILISAVTKDEGIGSGIANNGVLDGIVFTFSEPVKNIVAGASISYTNATTYVNLAIPVTEGMAFNQGSGSSAANVHTIPVGETTINTGVTPPVDYYELQVAARIKDYAKNASLSDMPNSFYASNTVFAAATNPQITTIDGAPMVVHSVETLDASKDGRLDHIRVTFSEDTSVGASVNGVDFYSSTTAFASAGNANGVYVAVGVSGGGGPTLEFTITPVTTAGVYDTEAAPNFRYDPNATSANIADATGNPLGAFGPGGFSHAPTKDKAEPVVVKYITNDAYTDTAYAGGSSFESEGADGRIDQVKVVFSEKVKTDEGAQIFGATTALDNMIGQFTVTHGGTGRTKMLIGAAIGKPVFENKENLGDSWTEVTVPFQEISMGSASMTNHGDTGLIPTVTYTSSATTVYNIKDLASEPNKLTTVVGAAGADGAKPYLVYGLGFGALAFTNVTTMDTPVNTATRAGVSNSLVGDGYIDAYVLKFSESVTVPVTVPAGNPNAFTVDLPGDGAISFATADGGAILGSGGNTLTITGTNDKKSGADTSVMPPLSYNKDKLTLQDGATTVNKVASFTDRVATDGAPPVIVSVNGAEGLPTKLNFTFSEPVYAHDATAANISFNAVSTASSALFAYENLGAGAGASGFTAVAVTQPSARILQATINANLTVVDIENDLVWVRMATIFDDANATYGALSDNAAISDPAGANIKFWIFDDVIAPWIINMSTVDFNLNGKVDHIRVTLSENIVDSSIKGYVAENAMSDDVSGTWIIGSNYTGPARWNLFQGNKDAGKTAAIAAGKPAFSDNAKDDAILYLELDENLVPANSNSGIGSTGFKPTVTWGTGAAAETLGDARPNVLKTDKLVADVADALDLKPTNGVVLDKLGPVIVDAAISGKQITVLFSEDVAKTSDVKYAEYFKVDGSFAKIWGLSWTNASSLVITMKPDWSVSTSAATTVEVNGTTAPIQDLTDLADTQDPANAAGLAGDDPRVWVRATNTTGAMTAVYTTWTAVSPASKVPNTGDAVTRGAFKTTNNSWITFRDIGDAQPHAGESVRIRWYYSNITNVDAYISFNNQETFELVPGSTTLAADGAYYWTARMGVTDVRIQSADNSAVKLTTSLSVVYDGDVVGASVGAPANLVLADVPGDNGNWMFATFTVSPDHLTAVKSYIFYRQVDMGTAEAPALTWVQSAVVPAGIFDADRKMVCLVPTVVNGEATWAVAASTGQVVTPVGKEADMPVALLVDGAEKAAGDVLSAMSEPAIGGAIDNIAPSPIVTFAADDNEGAGAGIKLSWTAPADHGMVGSIVMAGMGSFPIYGVDSYEVWRKTGTDAFVLVSSAAPMSTSYIDPVNDSSTEYSYMIKAVDSAHSVETGVKMAMAFKGGADFTSDNLIDVGDLVLLGSHWGAKSTDANWVSAFDLKADGVIDVGDLVLLGSAWTTAGKVAKVALPITSDVALTMSASYDNASSIYYVNIAANKVDGFNGIGFTMSYDTDALEFVKDGITGLGTVSITREAEAGIVDINSYFMDKEFTGTITVGFKSRGMNKDLDFELVNASVSINNVISAVDKLASITVEAIPTVYSLNQNFPNPFNPTTTIEYSIPQAGHVELVIYNMAGQKVRTLINENQPAAYKKVVWDGRNDMGEMVGAGMYFSKLVSGNFSKIQKMMFIK